MTNPMSIASFTGFKAHEFSAHSGKTNCVAVGPRSGQVLATGGDDKRVEVWRIGRASSIWSLTGNSSAIESLRFDHTEEFLISGSAGGAVKLFDLTAGKMTRHFRGHMSNVTVIDCGRFDRRFVTTGSMDCKVKLWNIETKECAMAFKGHNSEITDVQLSPDGYILASAAADGQVKLWDLRAGKPMHTFQACSGAVRALRFNPQELLLAAATSDRTVKLYDIETMELFCVTAPDTCPTGAMTFDQDGQNIFCASPSGLRHWTWDNKTATAKLKMMGDVAWGKVGVGALHYNADGRQIIAASCAGARVSVWAVDFDGDADPRDYSPTASGFLTGSPAALGVAGIRRPLETPDDRQAAAQAIAMRFDDDDVAGSRARKSTGTVDGKGRKIASIGSGDDGGDGRERGLESTVDNEARAKPQPKPISRSPDDTKGRGSSGGERFRGSKHRAPEKQREDDSPGAPTTAFRPVGPYPSPSPITAEDKSSSDRPAVAEVAVSTTGRHRSIGTFASETLIGIVSSSKDGGSAGESGNIGAMSISAGRTDLPETKGRGGGGGSGGGDLLDHGNTERYRAPPGSFNDALNEKWLQGGVIASAEEKQGSGAARGGRRKEERKSVGAFEKQSAIAAGKSRIVAEEESSWMRGGSEEIGKDSPPLLGSVELSPSTSRSRSASPLPSMLPPRAVPLLSRPSHQAKDVVVSGNGVAAVDARSTASFSAGTSITVDTVSVASSDASAVDLVGLSMADGESRSTGARFGGEDGREDEDELGMTRPRTATRRWGRPGPPGDDEDEVITKTLLSRATVTSALSQRLAHIRLLRASWAEGDVSGSISRLKHLERSATSVDVSPRKTVADFLWVVPLDGSRVTLEHCLELIPLLEDMWKLDAESSVAAATRCLEVIVRRFGDFVRETLAAPVSAGRVDLARDERIERCREAHKAFIRGYHHLERAEREFYGDRRIVAVAEQLRPLFDSYFIRTASKTNNE